MFSGIRCRLASFTRSAITLNKPRTLMLLPHTIEATACTTHNLNLVICRYKSKNKKSKVASESESEKESEAEEEILDKNTKLINANVNSLRMDILLKMGLGMARNKIDTLFYESKIRLNGEKVMKKSYQVNVGDEIDIIKGVSKENPNFLVVARVEVLNASGKENGLKVKLRRNKSLLIENYSDPWKGGPEAEKF